MEGELNQEESSPQVIEEEIKSIKTEIWDPFTILPKEMYLKIFDKLDSPAHKKNFMNAHIKWYDLFKDKRGLFLFQDTFKEIDKILIDEQSMSRQDLLNYRLVCHDWDKSIQHHFQFYDRNFTLDTIKSNRHYILIGIGPHLNQNHDKRDDLAWNKTHLAPILLHNWEAVEKDFRFFNNTHPPSKNPFLPRKLWLLQSGCVTAFDSVLERYGRHIWHLDLWTDLTPNNLRQLVKWLKLMPDLMTFNLQLSRSNLAPQHSPEELKEIRDMEVIKPELNKLEVLKSSGVPSEVFNKLFGNLKSLEKLQIWLDKECQSFLRDFVVPTDYANLKGAFLTLNGLEDFEFLGRSQPFSNIKKLVLTRKFGENHDEETPPEWPEWTQIFNILEEKFPALEDLTLKLPKAILAQDEENAVKQSLVAKLNLPNLKKLWMVLPNSATIDFLSPCKALEELKVILDRKHVKFEFGPEAWGSEVGQEEKIKLNVDLKRLWESNVWDMFPKLKVLEVEAFRLGRSESHRYEKKGEKRKYQRL